MTERCRSEKDLRQTSQPSSDLANEREQNFLQKRERKSQMPAAKTTAKTTASMALELELAHEVNHDDYYYAADKSTVVHFPGGGAMEKGHMDVLSCTPLLKLSSLKLKCIPGTWVVGDKPTAVVLPKLAHFIDERDPCIAIFWRITEMVSDPRVVCLVPPFDLEKVPGDQDLRSCKLSQIKSFSTIKNESGGSLLTFLNKYLKDSAIFKQHKLATANSVFSFVSNHMGTAGMFSACSKVALGELELRVRRSQHTRRAAEKGPKAQAEKENQEAELAKMREELVLIEELKKKLALLECAYELPIAQRLLLAKSQGTWEADLTAMCVGPQHMPVL